MADLAVIVWTTRVLGWTNESHELSNQPYGGTRQLSWKPLAVYTVHVADMWYNEEPCMYYYASFSSKVGKLCIENYAEIHCFDGIRVPSSYDGKFFGVFYHEAETTNDYFQSCSSLDFAKQNKITIRRKISHV